MADFNDEHKEEQGKYFDIGIHEVVITDVTGGTNDNDKEYIEFTVEGAGKDAKEGKARMWFTTDKAIKYTFNNIRGIFVHNAPEDKKEKAREIVNKTKNSEELVALCKKALVAKLAWYQVEQSDYTYVNQAGETKNGYNRNITGYEPTPKPKTAVEKMFPDAEATEVPDDL